ncbi:hypothetical protein FG385_23850 [Amycolatopsis alkalitolerans]|uniref:Uncharacterized protein n=1 Tax=Amycolatopsis alkalitolerans TaxID=2547244 RepID=A0A5C4LUM3_9PSEU|nr:hypothetical protein FG385_23850 [Amycolatopsis alkalitolerans]
MAAGSGGRLFSTELAGVLGAGPADTATLLRGARRVAEQPGRFISWLRNSGADEKWVRETVARSYWHPNGFAKLAVHVSGEPQFRLRLHVWPAVPGAPAGESNPHSHRWDFASTVLVGTGMHMVEYAESANGRPYDRYRYGEDPADPAALRADGHARLKKTGAPHVWRGGLYTCNTKVVHTVVPVDNGLTATVVVQGPHLTRSTVVYREPGQSDDQPNRPLTEGDFHLLVKEVITGWENGA